MAKRTRGTVRPGQRRPVSRPGTRPAGARPAGARPAEATASVPPVRPTALTPDEEARAAELEAAIVAEERAAETAQRRTRERAREADLVEPRTRQAAPLAVRAANEYAYVRRDIVRIARVAALLLIVIAILHVLINVAGVIRV